MPTSANVIESAERVMARIAFKVPRIIPVSVAAAAFALTRRLRGRREESRAYAWLAGLRGEPPSLGPETDPFDTETYFEKLEDESYEQYITSNGALVRWSTPDVSATICDLGCGRGFLVAELCRRGYEHVVGYEISSVAVQHRVTDEVKLFPGFAHIPDNAYHTVCLISVLEHIPPTEIDAFIENTCRIARSKIVCCIPVYPNNLPDFFNRDLTHRVLARRSWWNERFGRFGFVPDALPPQQLHYVEPFVYARSTATN